VLAIIRLLRGGEPTAAPAGGLELNNRDVARAVLWVLIISAIAIGVALFVDYQKKISLSGQVASLLDENAKLRDEIYKLQTELVQENNEAYLYRASYRDSQTLNFLLIFAVASPLAIIILVGKYAVDYLKIKYGTERRR